MKNFLKTSLITFLFGMAAVVYGQAPPANFLEILQAFRKYKEIREVSIKVPTVIEIPLGDDFLERFDFAVLNQADNKFEPHYFRQDTKVNKIQTSIPYVLRANLMLDGDVNTYAEFALPEDAHGQVQLEILGAGPITSSALTLLLDNFVALPTSIEIRARVDGADRIVVAKRSLERQSIQFPKTTSNEWRITLAFSQPLRITELRLEQENTTKTSSQGLRFLAKPNTAYRIYFDSDRQVGPPVGEAPNLTSNEDVLLLGSIPTIGNPTYTLSDSDKDNVPDIRDNCISTANTDQQDVNGNGRGDACDDFDKDGIINSKDNCPENPNRDQRNEDGDGLGDACDTEESRITEKYPWLPWIGIGFAALVLIALFALTAWSTKPKMDQ